MRTIFFGTGQFAVPSLEALVDSGHEVVAVVTQPDRRQGRGRGLSAPPVKLCARARDLHVLQPEQVKSPQALEALREIEPEVQVVAAYGQILPRALLDLPAHGTVNVHASVLPSYRGAAPVQWAIANGETETGVTTMLVDEGLDTGPVLLTRATPIAPEETAESLERRLARLGSELLVETLEALASQRLTPRPQDDSRSTRAPRLRKQDGQLDWSLPAVALERRIRAFQPWPGAATAYQGRGLQVRAARLAEPGPGDPGTVVAIERDGIVVACGAQTRLRLLQLQPESRRVMSSTAFAAGARIHPGARLG